MLRWFRQYRTVSWNAFVVTLGSPFSLIIQLTILGCGALLACLPFFTFGEQLRLIRDQSLALCFLGGCVASAFGASVLVVDDIRRGAAAVMMSRPVTGFCYVAGKWSGLMLGVCVIQITACAACLWLTSITANEDRLDPVGLSLYLGAIIVALALMAAKHYFFGGCYVWQANVAVLGCFLCAFLVGGVALHGADGGVDWPTAGASALILAALLIYSSLAVLFSTVLDTGMLLGACVVTFFGGLLAEYILTGVFTGAPGLTVGRALLPNWQLFWISDRLAEGKAVPFGYVGHCFVHALLYASMVLFIATACFRRRELGGAE